MVVVVVVVVVMGVEVVLVPAVQPVRARVRRSAGRSFDMVDLVVERKAVRGRE